MNNNKVDQNQMWLIAIAMSALIADGEAYIAEWEDRDEPNPDITVGSGNNWWLRRTINKEKSDSDLYLQARYHDWLTNGWDELSRYQPGRAWIAWRMIALCDHIKETLGIKISLPFTPEDAKAAMPKRSGI